MSEAQAGFRDADVEALGLDPQAIRDHSARLLDTVRRDAKPLFPVIDTCRFDNGGLVRLATAQVLGDAAAEAAGYAAFVPAAGAASRYSQPLFALAEALEQGDHGALSARLKALAEEGAASWPLPERVHALLEGPAAAQRLSRQDAEQLHADLQLPKALMPSGRDGRSFLAVKDAEHGALRGLAGQVFIAPPGQSAAFRAQLAKDGKSGLSTHVLEQGPALSTLRLHRDGRPFVEPDGRLSPVPAGHGALARLFPEAKRCVPKADSLFIRNIDNVMGTGADVIAATQSFLTLHRALLSGVQGIRTALARGARAEAERHAARLHAALTGKNAAGEDPVWALQRDVFHADPAATPSPTQLAELYARPVNLLGQVPNTGKDVGGTPCFVDNQGRREKVCIEVPHVSAADKTAYLANPEKATHFNPVFCAVEVPASADWYAQRNRDYWLMSEKTYRGAPVMYFETVLYELIGNSTLANCVFSEVPRGVFHPHKTLKDALAR